MINKRAVYQWHTLAASTTELIKGGLGEYLCDYMKLNPRHASVIATIMDSEQKINYKGKDKIVLKRNRQITNTSPQSNITPGRAAYLHFPSNHIN